MKTNLRSLSPIGVLLPALLLCVAAGATVAATKLSENTLKAALVFKLTKFVDWPAEVTEHQDRFRICALNQGVLGGELSALGGKKTHSTRIEFATYVPPGEGLTSNCRVMFISRHQIGDTDLKTLAHQPVLTISDSNKFAENGGDIEIRRDGKRFRFFIHLDNIKAKGLKIATPLLQLSTVIRNTAP